MPFEEALQRATKGEIVGCSSCGASLLICWLKAGYAQELDKRCKMLALNRDLETMVDRIPILALWEAVDANEGPSAIPESCKEQFTQSDLEAVDQFDRAHRKVVPASSQNRRLTKFVLTEPSCLGHRRSRPQAPLLSTRGSSNISRLLASSTRGCAHN